MLSTSADFWPLFWGFIGGGAVLTAVVTLFVATLPLHRVPRHERPVAASAGGAEPGQGDTGKHLPAAA